MINPGGLSQQLNIGTRGEAEWDHRFYRGFSHRGELLFLGTILYIFRQGLKQIISGMTRLFTLVIIWLSYVRSLSLTSLRSLWKRPLVVRFDLLRRPFNPFSVISGLSCACYVHSIPGFQCNLFPVSCGDIGLLKKSLGQVLVWKSGHKLPWLPYWPPLTAVIYSAGWSSQALQLAANYNGSLADFYLDLNLPLLGPLKTVMPVWRALNLI